MSNYGYEIFKKPDLLGENNNQSTDMEKEILAHIMTLETLVISKYGVETKQYNEILEMHRKQIEEE